MVSVLAGVVSTLVELGELIRSRPGLDTPPEQVAAWYERKAVVLGHLAAETGDPDAAECGRVAHEHAVALLAPNNVLIGGPSRQGTTAGMRAVLAGQEVTR